MPNRENHEHLYPQNIPAIRYISNRGLCLNGLLVSIKEIKIRSPGHYCMQIEYINFHIIYPLPHTYPHTVLVQISRPRTNGPPHSHGTL